MDSKSAELDDCNGELQADKSIMSLFHYNHVKDGNTSDEMHQVMKEELDKHLKTNKYLLLIDDVWSSYTWQIIRRYFPDNDTGSRIIVTTRFPAVAMACSANENNDHIHNVKVLSNDESKALFQKSLTQCRGTGHSQPDQNKDAKYPDRVWKICGGLPLAVVTMAGLVASKPLMVPTYWTTVCDSLFPGSQSCSKPEDFMRIIAYCYIDLPSDLKTCTLYLNAFPKGKRINRNRLIRRWVAEGFVQEKHGLNAEDIAETYFDQLIERKILWPAQHTISGRVKSCQVHDMIHEYIIAKAAEEGFVTVLGGNWSVVTRSRKVRRLSLHNSNPAHAKVADDMNLSHVRSLTVFGSLDGLHLKAFTTGILQVLDFEACTGFRESQMKIICKMVLLKYLSLRGTNVTNLPSHICKLKYLETLDIRETAIRELPKAVGELEHIKNLFGGNKKTRKGVKLPKEIKKGAMKTLQILSGIEFSEGSTIGSNVHEFTKLKKLSFYKIYNNRGIYLDVMSSIQHLGDCSLESLAIDDESSCFLGSLYSMSSPPVFLIALELSGRLVKLPKWISRLHELSKLTLSATVLGTANLVILSKLPSLFSLTFSISRKSHEDEMENVLKYNMNDSSEEIFIPGQGFTKLKLLRIFIPVLFPLKFSKNSTPELERVELRFKMLVGISGMEELVKLHDVFITVDGQASEETKNILEDLRRTASKHSLTVGEYCN